MPVIHQTPSAMSVKPLASTDKKASAPIKSEKSPNTDRVSVVAPELILENNEQAVALAEKIRSSVNADPMSASVTHTADYRLMEILRA